MTERGGLILGAASKNDLQVGRTEPLYLKAAHLVYTLNSKAEPLGDISREAAPAFWRFLVCNKSGALATTDVPLHLSPITAHEAHLSCSLSVGEYSRRFSQGLSRANARISRDWYEVRCLEVPHLFLYFLWFHAPHSDLYYLLGSHVDESATTKLLTKRAVARLVRDRSGTARSRYMDTPPALRLLRSMWWPDHDMRPADNDSPNRTKTVASSRQAGPVSESRDRIAAVSADSTGEEEEDNADSREV